MQRHITEEHIDGDANANTHAQGAWAFMVTGATFEKLRTKSLHAFERISQLSTAL